MNVNKSSIFTILPILTHATCMFLVLFVLISPAPLSFSSISLLKVEPYNLNSNSNSSSSTSIPSVGGITFGGSSSISSTSSQPSSSSTSISESIRSHSSTSSDASATQTAASSSSSPIPTPTSTSTSTSIAARGFVVKRSQQLQVREQLSNMTGPGGIYLNGTEQSLLANQTADSSFSSKVQLSFGPLGSCFTDGEGNKVCTSSRLSPSYESDQLKQAEYGGYVTSGLLDRLPTTPILLLVVLVISILTLGINTLITLTKLIPSNPTISTFLEAGPRNRGLATMRKYSVYASTISWLILLCSIVSMRIFSNKAANSFNASNSNKALPANLVTSDDGQTDTSNVLGLKAKVGAGFTMLWIAMALMGLLLFLERRHLKNDQAVAQARADIEARHGRSAFSNEMQSVEVKPIQQLPYPNESQPYGSSFNQYSSSGSIYSGYPVSTYGKSRPSSPTPTTRTQITRTASPAPTYRGGPMNSNSSNKSYWTEEKSSSSHHEGIGEEMSWRLVGNHSGKLYN